MVGKCKRVSGRIVVSAVIGWALIPIANADAPPPSDAKPEITNTAAAGNGAGNSAGETAHKPLHTVPEDGMGDTKWLSGATRIVREITVKRPKEDLIICIAGCVPKQERVVYAQPTEYVAPKPDTTASDSSGAAPKMAPATAEMSQPKPKPASAAAPSAAPMVMPAADAKTVEDVKVPTPMNAAAPSDAKPAIAPAANATAPADLKKNEFVPSMAQPKSEQPKSEQPK